MYVAEMHNYPLGPASGTIRWLTDRDGDGRYETATIFADKLNFPNGLLCANGGLFVTAARICCSCAIAMATVSLTSGTSYSQALAKGISNFAEWTRLGPRQLDLWRQRPQRRSGASAGRPCQERHFHPHAQFSLSPGRQPLRAGHRPKSIRRRRTTIGATDFSRGTRSRSARLCSTRLTWLTIRSSHPCSTRIWPILATRAKCFRSHRARKRLTASRPTTITRYAG